MVKPVNRGLTGSVFGRFTISRAAGLFSAEFENRYDDNNRPGDLVRPFLLFLSQNGLFRHYIVKTRGYFVY
jgi:hypothetical protein